MRPEDDLLLCCARLWMDSEVSEKVTSLLQNEMDWSYLRSRAQRHGLTPLLYRSLKCARPQAVPEAILDQLRQYFLANAWRNLLLTEELLEVLDLFKTHGIPAIPYKGPVLAASIYGDLGLRQMSDLDILIPKEEILKARHLLVSLGYQTEFQFANARQAAAYQRSQYELVFTRYQGKVITELKWEIVDRFFSFPMAYRGLWERLKPISLAGKEVFTLSPEDLILILCVHGAKHLWTSLIWVCDVARLLYLCKGLDWEWIVNQASLLGGQRILYLGLLLSKDLLGASVPEEIGKRVGADPMVRRLAEQVKQNLFQASNGSPPSLWESSIFHLKVRENLQDRIRYCGRLVLNTTPGDWNVRSLPDSLSPLYYLIRPFRLSAKYGLGLLGHINDWIHC